MKNNYAPQFLTVIIATLLALLLTACSDSKTETNATAQQTAQTKKPHHEDIGEANQTVKHKFAAKFAENCVKRESKNSVNQDNDEKRAAPACECIAEKIAEDLSDLDAEKYLQDHEDTQTLEIKFDHAAFFCLQNKPQPKGPHLFGKQ